MNVKLIVLYAVGIFSIAVFLFLLDRIKEDVKKRYRQTSELTQLSKKARRQLRALCRRDTRIAWGWKYFMPYGFLLVSLAASFFLVAEKEFSAPLLVFMSGFGLNLLHSYVQMLLEAQKG